MFIPVRVKNTNRNLRRKLKFFDYIDAKVIARFIISAFVHKKLEERGFEAHIEALRGKLVYRKRGVTKPLIGPVGHLTLTLASDSN